MKTKFEVHCAPSVSVCTPGWTGAVAAGAQAEAVAGRSEGECGKRDCEQQGAGAHLGRTFLSYGDCEGREKSGPSIAGDAGRAPRPRG